MPYAPDTTDRYALPLLAAGQAQKELFHNEALARIDALLHATVEAVGLNAAPSAPVAGQCWIVGTAPSGAFAGQAGALACWTVGGWRFVAPRAGMAVWSAADQGVARFDGTGWSVAARHAAIADPAGGTTVDSEARAAISAILATLRAHLWVFP